MGDRPKKRNVNNEVCLYVKDNLNFGVGDSVLGTKFNDAYSAYEVTEVMEKRPGALSGRVFMRVKTKWYMLPEAVVQVD